MSSPSQQMIVNYVPNEECRIAILESGRLEEFYAERVESQDGAGHVGNIYVGKVTNVESSIQAAFIDFGVGRNGFLHISDLHPRYFSASDREETETVGHKTPHRHRPPIQSCLSRGQEIMVQVLKEGIGSKGPTLTSYLSIPGRYLVLMPYMERSGVSRKVEDMEERRSLHEALDALELPDGFGFIVRTAAYGRPKADLKRDLSYLQRLWKAISNKQRSHKAPCELYAESDLLIRTIRDVMSPDVKRIVIDDESAHYRVEEFLSVVAPRRSSAVIESFDQPVPIFHYFGIEEQIRQIHARQVPLPSGGSLVIDSTEAMVTIDVNSGRMRQSHDAETTAYRTNLEAVDEITRQLRLRDLGGLVVLDLIDMRSRHHQREIENQLRLKLKRDRAKTEFLRISRFGILEMTRQRMRPSLNKSYFIECPGCQGRGHVKTADATAVESMRELAYLLHHPKVARAEMVVSDSVAAAILSRFRRQLTTLEDTTGTTVQIRISKVIASDRVDFYIYDESDTDLDIDRMELHTSSSPKQKQTPRPTTHTDANVKAAGDRTDSKHGRSVATSSADESKSGMGKQSDREESCGRPPRRQGRKKSPGQKAADSETPASVTAETAVDSPTDDEAGVAFEATEPVRKRKTRRKRRSNRNRKTAGEAEPNTTAAAKTDELQTSDPASADKSVNTSAAVSSVARVGTTAALAESSDESSSQTRKKKKRRTHRRGDRRSPSHADDTTDATGSHAVVAEKTADVPREKAAVQGPQSESEPRKKKSRSRRSTRTKSRPAEQKEDDTASPSPETPKRESASVLPAKTLPAPAPAPLAHTQGEPVVAVTGAADTGEKKGVRRLYGGSHRRRRTHS